MKVIKVVPYEKAKVVEIESGLESLQHEVEGYIECVYPFEDAVGIICNEEGKINGMEYNRALRDEDGEIYDIIAGPFLIVGLSDDDFTDLTEEQIEAYQKMFLEPEMFMYINGKIRVIA